jgi:hypothetical protein
VNVFAEGIVKYDHATKVEGVHCIKMNPPLPLGSSVKMSRLCLDNDEQMTPDVYDRLRRETFIDTSFAGRCRYQAGVFVHVFAAPAILVPGNNVGDPDVRRHRLYLHLVEKELFHLVERQEEYELWRLTGEEEEMLRNKQLTWR